MAKPRKGVVPPQLKGYQFTKGSNKPKAAGKRGGMKSRPKKG